MRSPDVDWHLWRCYQVSAAVVMIVDVGDCDVAWGWRPSRARSARYSRAAEQVDTNHAGDHRFAGFHRAAASGSAPARLFVRR